MRLLLLLTTQKAHFCPIRRVKWEKLGKVDSWGRESLLVWRAASPKGWMDGLAMLKFLELFQKELVSTNLLVENSNEKKVSSFCFLICLLFIIKFASTFYTTENKLLRKVLLYFFFHFCLKVLLLLDGHASHVTYSVVQFCKDAGIVLFRLYPNSTHILQPADASAMASLKQEWDKVVKKLRREQGCSPYYQKDISSPDQRSFWSFATKQEPSSQELRCYWPPSI